MAGTAVSTHDTAALLQLDRLDPTAVRSLRLGFKDCLRALGSSPAVQMTPEFDILTALYSNAFGEMLVNQYPITILEGRESSLSSKESDNVLEATSG